MDPVPARRREGRSPPWSVAAAVPTGGRVRARRQRRRARPVAAHRHLRDQGRRSRYGAQAVVGADRHRRRRDRRTRRGAVRPVPPARHRRRVDGGQPLARRPAGLRRGRQLRRAAAGGRRALRAASRLRRGHGRGPPDRRPVAAQRRGRSPRVESPRGPLAPDRGGLPDPARRVGHGAGASDRDRPAVDGHAADPDLRPGPRGHRPEGQPRGLRPVGRAGLGPGQQRLRRDDGRSPRARPSRWSSPSP